MLEIEIDDLKYFLNKIDDQKYQRMFDLLIEAFNIKYETTILSLKAYYENKGYDSQIHLRDYKNYILDELLYLMKPAYDSFYPLVSELLLINKKHRKQQSSIISKHHLTLQQYLKEFGTVKLSLGRQTGKTSAAIKLLTENNEYKDSSVIVVSDSRMKHATYHKIIKDNLSRRVLTVHDFLCKSSLDSIKLIIIDECSFISDENIERIYNCFGKNTEQTFLFLG